MNDKYFVFKMSTSNSGASYNFFKNKKEISTRYDIPLYMVDKIINMSNHQNFKTKRLSHLIYQDLMQHMRIYLIKPSLL